MTILIQIICQYDKNIVLLMKLICCEYYRMQRHVIDPSVPCGFIRGSRTIASVHVLSLLSFATMLPFSPSFKSR
jgi:hypothetical protein